MNMVTALKEATSSWTNGYRYLTCPVNLTDFNKFTEQMLNTDFEFNLLLLFEG